MPMVAMHGDSIGDSMAVGMMDMRVIGMGLPPHHPNSTHPTQKLTPKPTLMLFSKGEKARARGDATTVGKNAIGPEIARSPSVSPARARAKEKAKAPGERARANGPHLGNQLGSGPQITARGVIRGLARGAASKAIRLPSAPTEIKGELTASPLIPTPAPSHPNRPLAT